MDSTAEYSLNLAHVARKNIKKEETKTNKNSNIQTNKQAAIM